MLLQRRSTHAGRARPTAKESALSRLACGLLSVLLSLQLHAQSEPEAAGKFGFADAASDARWEIGLTFLGITALGVRSWNWGSSEFHFNSEHWFSMDTGSGGADKLGHAYSSYAMSDFIHSALSDAAEDRHRSAAYASLITAGLMLYVEVFDGVSDDHGFAYEDLIANTAGQGLSYLRNTHPGLAEKLDYRLEYWPSKYVSGWRPFSDYNGQTYVLALKLSGFEATRDSALSFLELHLGYKTRGFVDAGEASDDDRRAKLYVGFSLDFAELFFGPIASSHRRAAALGRTALEYLQPPFTSISLGSSERRRLANRQSISEIVLKY